MQIQITTRHHLIPIRMFYLCLYSVAQSHLTLCNPMDCRPPGSSVHRIFQVRILEWVAISFSSDLPDPGIEPMSLASPTLAGRFFTTVPPGKPLLERLLSKARTYSAEDLLYNTVPIVNDMLLCSLKFVNKLNHMLNALTTMKKTIPLSLSSVSFWLNNLPVGFWSSWQMWKRPIVRTLGSKKARFAETTDVRQATQLPHSALSVNSQNLQKA